MNSTLPFTRFEPSEVAPDTFIIHNHHGEGVAPVSVGLNSLVIRSAEPVVVDSGMPANRDQFLADVFSIVEPQDVRWVFLSHDDVDHFGNINALMERCERATLVVNWFMTERLGEELQVPPHRQRWVNDGETLDVGDRRLVAVRPPIYDSPTTRGLFDPTTGFYWASDSFATPMLTPTTNVETLDAGFWKEGFALFHKFVSPWYELLDDAAFQRTVDRIESLGVTSIAGCHTPLIGAGHVATAFEHMRTFRSVDTPGEPTQALLDEIIQATSAAAA
jgi:flavorubredoxin